MAFDWTNFVVDGGARPDAMSGLSRPFEASLATLFSSAPPEIQSQLRIGSAFRSPERQAELYAEAVKKYGSEEAARKWVAPPGKSQHNHGSAADLRYLSPAAKEWVHANAAKFGLHFPLAHEPWHVEPIGSRSATAVGPTPRDRQDAPAVTSDPIIRLAFAYANGKMTPEDAALYEQGMAAGDFPTPGKQPDRPDPLAALGETLASQRQRRVAVQTNRRAPAPQADLNFMTRGPLSRLTGI